jgi:hypothetical protein
LERPILTPVLWFAVVLSNSEPFFSSMKERTIWELEVYKRDTWKNKFIRFIKKILDYF